MGCRNDVFSADSSQKTVIRWEKKTDNYSVMFTLACSWMTFRAAELFG